MKSVRSFSKTLSGITALALSAAVMTGVPGMGTQVAAYTSANVNKDNTLSLGGAHSAVVDESGGLWMWGYDGQGQLGNGRTKSSSADPEKIMDNVKTISMGSSHSGAVKKDGTLWMWGSGNAGILGNDSTTNAQSPIQIMTDVESVALGNINSAAIKTDGSLWVWGHSLWDDEDTVSDMVPVKVADDMAAVACDDTGFIALSNDGVLYDYYVEINYISQLEYTPTKVMEDVVDISSGAAHFAAIKSDGSLWLWGDNTYGQVGAGYDTVYDSPVKVMDDVADVALGSEYSAAIKKDGTLWTWGDNSWSQLGNGSTTSSYSPIQIMSDVSEVSLNFAHTIARKNDGSVWIWGTDGYGRLGNVGSADTSKPVMIMEGSGFSIVTQPQSVYFKDNLVPDTYSFTIDVMGDSITYQWQENAGTEWKNIDSDSAKTDTLVVTNPVNKCGYKYRCIVSDGETTITSDEAVITVKLSITKEPSSFEGSVGDTAKFIYGVQGASKYQWQENTGSSWADIDGDMAKTNTYSIAVTADNIGYKYRCIASNTTGSVTSEEASIGLSDTFTVTSVLEDQEAAVGEKVSFRVEGTGMLTYQWQQNTGSGWSNISTSAGKSRSFTVEVTAARYGYKYRCAVGNGSETITTNEALILPEGGIMISSQPSDFKGKIGDTAKFTVEVLGSDVSYQWQQDTGKGWTDIAVSAGRKSSLSIVVSQARLNYSYRCVVTNGRATLTTNAVKMVLDEEFAITSQPENYKGKIGDTAKFTVEATGVTSYQWQQNTGSGWVNIATSAGRSKSIALGLTQARLNFKYRCIISNGTNTLTTNEVKLILDEALAITSQPVNFTGKIGDTAKFTVEATGVTSYQWQQNTGSGWVNIATSAGRSKSITLGLTQARLNFKYRCVISNGTDTLTTDEVKLVLDEELAITAQPENFKGKVGDTAKFVVEATGVVSYQWQQNTGSGWVNINTSAGRSKSITVGLTQARLNFKYRCVLSNGTDTLTTDEVKLILDEKLAITAQPSDYMAAAGETVKFTVTATGAASYQWQVYNGTSWSDINTSAGRSSSITVTATAARNGFIYRCIVSNGTESITSNEAVLKVS